MGGRRTGVFLLAAALASGACATAVPTDTPGLSRVREYVLAYDGPELRSELGYRAAASRLGEEWLLLKLSLSAARGALTTVEGAGIRVRTPDGRELPLIDMGDFWGVHAELRIALDQMDAWGPPVARLEGAGRPCTEWFLAPPGSFSDRPYLGLDPSSWCSGPLVFRVPGGVQPGRWVLMIDLEESDVRIPFVLGD